MASNNSTQPLPALKQGLALIIDLARYRGTGPQAARTAMKNGLAAIIDLSRYRRRRTAKLVIAPPPRDPVDIAVLAMDRLGPASMRASSTGRAVQVAAPDETIAAVFRAALLTTTRYRPTDRLIEVCVEA